MFRGKLQVKDYFKSLVGFFCFLFFTIWPEFLPLEQKERSWLFNVDEKYLL